MSRFAEAMSGLIARKSGYDMHRDFVRWSRLLPRCRSSRSGLAVLGAGGAIRDGRRPTFTRQRNDLRFLVDEGWAEGVKASCWRELAP
ncbi:MAG: hypothetical protein IPQ07_12940 [Myxococcales bacterium]|nr:hypothetical protein [Myxococcales bacterium]